MPFFKKINPQILTFLYVMFFRKSFLRYSYGYNFKIFIKYETIGFGKSFKDIQ